MISIDESEKKLSEMFEKEMTSIDESEMFEKEISFESRDLQLCSSNRRMLFSMSSAYFIFFMSTGVVLRKFSDKDFSAVLTLGAGVQCLGFMLLLLKVQYQKSVAGISAKTLMIYLAVFLFRLSSTCVKSGYLPIDRSGDWVYQAADMASVAIIMQLLVCIFKTHKSTYQAEQDSLAIHRAIPPCVLMGIFFHGNLNHSPFFDIMWTISMNLDTIAMVPQLWMLSRIGGEVEGQTSHYVASIAISRALSFAFWFYGYNELAPLDGSYNFAGFLIMFCHAMQLLMSADFLYHYGSARVSGRRMTLGPALDV